MDTTLGAHMRNDLLNTIQNNLILEEFTMLNNTWYDPTQDGHRCNNDNKQGMLLLNVR